MYNVLIYYVRTQLIWQRKYFETFVREKEKLENQRHLSAKLTTPIGYNKIHTTVSVKVKLRKWGEKFEFVDIIR